MISLLTFLIGFCIGVIVASYMFLLWHGHLGDGESKSVGGEIASVVGSVFMGFITGVWGTIMFAFGKE